MRSQLIYTTIILLMLATEQASSQFIYTNPAADSKNRNPETAILLRCSETINPSSLKKPQPFTLTGSHSGVHTLTVNLTADKLTIIITPDKQFDYDEAVVVDVADGIQTLSKRSLKGITFNFKTRKENTEEETAQIIKAREETLEDNPYHGYAGNKTMDAVPQFSLFVDNAKVFTGAAFFGTKHNIPTNSDQFLCILKNDSTYSFARNVLNGYGSDFKINKNGYLTYYGFETHAWYMLDSNYNLIDSFKCKNGYEAEVNNHEFQIFPNGNKFFLIWHSAIVNMTDTVPGGYSAAVVTYPVIQEQDANDNVIFEWASWDHFSVKDATWDVSLTNGVIDPFHTNSIELDNDGNILISNRNMDEITKIDHATGNIIWRMGGEKNQFTFLNDSLNPPFSHQHDIRRIANGNVTLFDNGNLRTPWVSYADEYSLDEQNKTATLVWNYRHPMVNSKELISLAAGNAQRLPNGNTLIDYGVISDWNLLPNITEVTPDGSIAWELKFTETQEQTYSYRAYKFEWSPCARPTDYTMTAKAMSATRELLKWSAANGAIQYNVQYRQLGSSTWITSKSAAVRKRIMNLLPNTTYEWRLNSICPQSATSAYTAIHTFKTSVLKMEVNEPAVIDLQLFPNPASDHVTVQFDQTEESPVQITLRNLWGEIIYNKNFMTNDQTDRLELNTTDFPKGIYFITVSAKGKSKTEKLILE
jgi:hypothetical protein